MLITDIDVTPLVNSLETMGNNFPKMINTMKKVALLIEMNTEPLVPWDTRALKQSFEYVTGIRGNSIDLIVGSDEKDIDDGFHYAYIQHEKDFNHPRGGQRFYLKDGIRNSMSEVMTLIETDYLSLFHGGKIKSGQIGSNMDMRKSDIKYSIKRI